MFAKLNPKQNKLKDSVDGQSQPCLLIVEDDDDQSAMLSALVELECQAFFQKHFRCNFQDQLEIANAHSLSSLKKVLSLKKNIIQVICDCNLPDRKGERPHDQFVKKEFRITGQHRAVDLVLANSARPSLLMISQSSRFQKTVPQFYATTHYQKVLFAKKTEAQRIQQVVHQALSKHFLFS